MKRHHGDTEAIIVDANGERSQPSTALVISRLSIVPKGDTENALERADHFASTVGDWVASTRGRKDAANQFEVKDDASCSTADVIQNTLKDEVKDWNNQRLAVTRPIDDLKTYLTGLPKPGIEETEEAVRIYQAKITAYRNRVREDALKAQRESERLLREEQARLRQQAAKLQEKASTLKTEAGRQRAADEAGRLLETAELVPESVALAASEPELPASGTARIWEGRIPLCDACKAADAKRPDPKRECPHNRKLAVQAILDRWEMWGSVIEFRVGSSRDGKKGMNDLAAHCKDTIEIPGFVFESRESFRSKPSR